MIVYDGGRQAHLTSQELIEYLTQLDQENRFGDGTIVQDISDAAAQTIASYWHSPISPNSTLLSTMGKVSEDMDLSDFASQAEYMGTCDLNRLCLNYLEAYIMSKQDGPF